MEKLSANMNSVRPSMPEIGAGRTPSQTRGQDLKGPGFREQLSALQQQLPSTAAMPSSNAQAPSTLKFSNHAIDRMQSRGIRFSPDELGKIQGAVSKAAGKGSKDALLITDNAALIVSVKDNTVVTVMDKASLKDNVFTKIDSTVVI
jgi:flagellar operon protein